MRYVYCLVAFVVVTILFSNIMREKKLQKEFVITTGYITEFSPYVHSRYRSVNFMVKKKRYSAAVRNMTSRKFCSKVVPKTHRELKRTPIVVVYHPKDKTLVDVLLNRRDFKKYGVPYPKNRAPILEKVFGCE